MDVRVIHDMRLKAVKERQCLLVLDSECEAQLLPLTSFRMIQQQQEAALAQLGEVSETTSPLVIQR